MIGSVATGKAIMCNAAAHMTKVLLELGRKVLCIFMDNFQLDEDIEGIVASRIIYLGQMCNYVRQVYVQESVYDTFLAKFVAKMNPSKCGLLDKEGAQFYSLISSDHREKVQGMVNRAVTAVAKVEYSGKSIKKPGYCFAPTVLTGTTQDSDIVHSGAMHW